MIKRMADFLEKVAAGAFLSAYFKVKTWPSSYAYGL
jgi:hypothetical protein